MPRVVTVCRPPQAGLLDDVAARLRAAGCEVVSFGAVESFPTDGSALAEADVLVCSPALACTRALMAGAPRLRAVISPFIGVEGIDENAATELGILVANGQTSENAESMAEATILLMLAALYDLRHSEAVMRGEVSRPAGSRALMLRGRTVGLIGYGNIARAITVRLGGWGARLFAWSRRPDPSA